MGVTLWFIITLVGALCYGVKAYPELHKKTAFEMNGMWGLVACVGLVLGALILSRTNIDPSHHRTILLTIHTIMLFLTCYFGMCYWIRTQWWHVVTLLVATWFVAGYLSHRATFNNLIVCLSVLGLSLLGNFVNRGWVYVTYTILGIFDVSAVWFSNLMSKIVEKSTDTFPTGFLQFLVSSITEIGYADVLWTAIGVVIIRRYCGVRWGIGIAIAYVLSLFMVAFLITCHMPLFQNTPFMIFVSPLTISALWYGSLRHKAPSSGYN